MDTGRRQQIDCLTSSFRGIISKSEMLTKVWNYVMEKINPTVEVRAKPYPTRHQLRMQMEEERPDSDQHGSKESQGKASNLYQNSPQKGQYKTRYQLRVLGEQPPVDETTKMEDEVMAEVREVERSLRELALTEQRVTRSQARNQLNVQQTQKSKTEEPAQNRRNTTLVRNYKAEVEEYLGLKYTAQKAELPKISLEDYGLIQQYWADKRRYQTRTIRKTSLEGVEKLTYRAMGGIEHGEWLNDDAINMYLEMLDKQIRPKSGWRGKLMNTYFATTTLPKEDNKVKRFLSKQGITTFETPNNPPLLIPINQSNHWYLVQLTPSPPCITVMDSIKRTPYDYSKNPIFYNLQRLGRRLYGVDMTLEVEESYPQQDNGCDCGMFLLMGAKDIIEGKKEWSFQQGDIRFKRLQVAYELIGERITGGVVSD